MAQTMEQRTTPEGLQMFLEELAPLLEAVASGERLEGRRVFEIEQPCKDGSLVWTEVSVSIMRDESGEAVGIQGVSRDITERRRTEEALRMSEEKFSAAFRSSPDAIFLISVGDGRIIEANEAAARLTGHRAEEMLGRTTTDLGLWADPVAGEEHTALVLREGRVVDSEAAFRTTSGTIEVLLSSEIIPLLGSPCLVSTVRDITARKLAEKELAESERRFRLLAENSTDVVWSLGLDGRFTYVSPTVLGLRGYTVDEVMAQTMGQVLTPEGLAILQEGLATIFEPPGPGEDADKRRVLHLQQTCKDGSLVWTEVSAGVMRDESGEIVGIQGASRDITKRKRTEEALRLSEERFSAAFHSSPDAFFLTSVPEGRVVESNATASRMTGYTAEEMLGYTTTELGLWLDPAAREEYVARVQREGRVLDYEAQFRTPDGAIDGVISGEIVQLTDGPYFLSIVRDVTERKRAAEALMTQNRLLEEARLRLSARVEEKTRFVATVSHELRTPLAVVLGFASELSARADTLSAQEVAEFARLIREGCAAANNLVEDLLTAARIDIGPIAFTPEATDLESAALAVAAEPETASHLSLKSLHLAGTATVAWADPRRVRQIIRNLLVNAGRHGGSHISVASGVCSDSSAVFCRVVDDGPGVPDYLLDSLFLPYQHGGRDPGLTQSVGLGLYLSRNLARLMGGDLTYLRDGAFTVFELTLPGGRVAAAA